MEKGYSRFKKPFVGVIKERFIVHPNSKKQVFQALGSAFRNFKYLLTTKYILPHKHNRKRLKRPPFQYNHIPQNVWDKFVNSRFSTEFECSETGLVETEVDRSVAWKRARKMKNGEYDPDVDSVVKKIVSNSKFKGKCEYTQSELDEVRLEYASFVSELIV
ncbi:hypothetical protein CUMW_257710 [Citrus unshiu]|uniref:Uncharacterized protein n=1 Tax=Citrus unshiu TaxID=55188 RepID=A0A2H5QTH7_CITUN|nr:hypothetical protein CUMW_257710 [Citrus unshiu]